MGTFNFHAVITDPQGNPVRGVKVECLCIDDFTPASPNPQEHIVAVSTTNEAGEVTFATLDDTKYYFVRPRKKGLQVQIPAPAAVASGGMAQHANEYHDPDMVAVTGAQSVAGLKTFGDGIATDTIAEETATAGVTIDGSTLKDGFLYPMPSIVADAKIGWVAGWFYFQYDGNNTILYRHSTNTWYFRSAGNALLEINPTTIDAKTHKIVNVVDPTAAQDAATMNYVDVTHGGAADPHTGYLKESDNPILDADFSPGEGFMRKTGAGAYTAHKSNLAAATAPTANEDSGDGYSVGSIWIDTTADKAYVCLDAAVGAAVWTEITAGGAGHDAVTLAADAGALLGLTGQELTLDSQDANKVFAGPATGAAADPAFRALAAADIPDISATYLPISFFDAYGIPFANADNTPLWLTLGASRIVGRKATGGVVGLTGYEGLEILSGQATSAFSMTGSGGAQKITGLAAATTNGDAMRFDETPKLAGDLEGTVAAPTVKAASLTVAGKVELATAAETTTGTDATRAVTPDGLAGSDYGKRVMYLKEVVPAATALTTGDAKTTIEIFAVLNGWDLVDAQARVYTAPTGSGVSVAVRNGAEDMLSTLITIDVNETSSTTDAHQRVIDTDHHNVATGAIISIDIDAIGSTTPGNGLDVILTWQQP